MTQRETQIEHPIIESYVKDFIFQHEISEPYSLDQHTIFEQFINDLILSSYTNDSNASYEEMETSTAFGIDGVAIFISDRLVTSVEDVDSVIDGVKKFDVDFYLTQIKTTNKFERHSISDFLTGVNRFFKFQNETCEIEELEAFWETAKYIYSKSSKFKSQPMLHLKYISLASKTIDLNDTHLKGSIELPISKLKELNFFEDVELDFIGIKEIMNLQSKVTSELEVSISLTKQLIPYPKDPNAKIKSGYYGLIRLEEFIEILTEDINGERILRKRIFDDNIRYYLGADEKVEVNSNMKEQLTSNKSYLFGLLNNGITVISDEIGLNSEELTLTNYQIVNGCQTSNVIYECLKDIKGEKRDIFLPIRLIATEDEETKNNIIKATNSQTTLKPEQLAALSPIQKAIEKYYTTKNGTNKFPLYYERRTEQYRDDNIQKAKIINIPSQIKSTSSLFFDLPHQVSGQYGKVEKHTRGLLFKEDDLSYLNSYYVSGLAWYRVERFITNNDQGKKYRRARWHIIMLLKYYLCDPKKIELKINKKSEEISKTIEKILLDESKCDATLASILTLIIKYFEDSNIPEQLSDRKLFERKETTTSLIEYIKKSNTFK